MHDVVGSSRADRRAHGDGMPGQRRPDTITEADAEGSDPPLSELGRLGAYLYEPDRAVIRAGLTGALAVLSPGCELDHGVGYVRATGWSTCPGRGATRVREAMPWNVKALRGWLRDHDIGSLTIKKRGVLLDPDTVRRQLRAQGSQEATLILTRIRSQPHALVVHPA